MALMFPPSIPVAATTRDLVACGVLVQRDLIGAQRLLTEARRRGISLPSGSQALEGLDRDGAFAPLAFHIGSRTSPTFAGEPHAHQAALGADGQWASAGYVFRDEAGFQPWSTYEFAIDGIDGVREALPLYSPWQLLALPLVEQGDYIKVPYTLLAGAEGKAPRLGEGTLGELADIHVRGRQRMHECWLPTIKLLLRLQARYWPLVRGESVMVYRKSDGSDSLERVDALDLEYAEASASDALALLGVSVEDVLSVYEWMCWRIESGADPARALRSLLRMLPRRRAETVTGSMLSALDLHDAAALLRRFHHELTGDLLPEPDQGHVRGNDVEARPLHRGRDELIDALASNGLTAHKLHVVAEGETEVRLLSGLFERFHGTTCDDAGVVITDLGGDKLEESRRFIKDFGIYARRVVLLLDDENDARRVADKFVADGIVAAHDVTLAKPSLEEENFTPDELIQLANALVAKRGVTLGFSGDDLDAALRARNAEPGRPVGMASMLVKMAANPSHGDVVKISKPDLADPMIELIAADIEQAPGRHEEVAHRRPVVGWVLRTMLAAALQP